MKLRCLSVLEIQFWKISEPTHGRKSDLTESMHRGSDRTIDPAGDFPKRVGMSGRRRPVARTALGHHGRLRGRAACYSAAVLQCHGYCSRREAARDRGGG
jgi:hypothetical protein